MNPSGVIDLSGMRFPRQLEADYGADAIRRVLADVTRKLWSGGDLDVPLIALNDPLKKALQAAMLKGRLCCGFEAVAQKLNNEKAGIEHVSERSDVSPGERISRLILLSNDGAERLYRHAEQYSCGPMPPGCSCVFSTRTAASWASSLPARTGR